MAIKAIFITKSTTFVWTSNPALLFLTVRGMLIIKLSLKPCFNHMWHLFFKDVILSHLLTLFYTKYYRIEAFHVICNIWFQCKRNILPYSLCLCVSLSCSRTQSVFCILHVCSYHNPLDQEAVSTYCQFRSQKWTFL